MGVPVIVSTNLRREQAGYARKEAAAACAANLGLLAIFDFCYLSLITAHGRKIISTKERVRNDETRVCRGLASNTAECHFLVW